MPIRDRDLRRYRSPAIWGYITPEEQARIDAEKKRKEREKKIKRIFKDGDTQD